MTLIIVMVVLVLLAILLALPIGAAVGYDNGSWSVYAQVWRARISLYPGKKREKTPKKQKTKKKKIPTDQPAVTKDEMLDGIEVAVKSIKKLKFRLHKLKLHFISAFEDPYDTAMIYVYASAGVQALGLPSLKQADVQLAVDFEREQYYLDTYVSVTIRIYYIVKLLCCLAVGLMPVLWRRRKRLTPEKDSGAVKGTVA